MNGRNDPRGKNEAFVAGPEEGKNIKGKRTKQKDSVIKKHIQHSKKNGRIDNIEYIGLVIILD
jgi:hypothetical protein